jgi:hydroxymethylglutaryl-CoA reductase
MNYYDFLYEQFPELLDNLHADTKPLWGLMNAQQMIEHLASIVSCSNGRFEAKPSADAERLAYRKMRYFEKDVPMPRSFRVDFVPETPHPVRYPNMEEAKNHLLQQLERFDDYYAEHPGLTAMHPVLGILNYDEWVQTHARHFKHHLQQFGILPLPIDA